VQIKKTDITATLRSRGQVDRADWVDKTLPPIVDTDRNSGLLKTLDIDLATMTAVESQTVG
jgi:hypothetical protein